MQREAMIVAASSLIALGLHGRPAACQESQAGAKEVAKKYFERGVVQFKAGDNEGALENFLASYKARPHAKVKFNIGICLYKLGRYAEAGNAVEEFLAKESAEFQKAMVDSVLEFLQEVRRKAGIVQVEVDEEGAEVWIDGKSLGMSPLASGIYVDPGDHELDIRARDGRKWSGKVKVGAGETRVVNVTLALEKAAEEKPATETKKEAGAKQGPEEKKGGPAAKGGRKKAGKALFYASLALAAASALGGAISGGVAMQKVGDLDDLDNECEANGCDGSAVLHDTYLEERGDIYGAAERAGNASTALLAAAGVFAGVSIVCLLAWKPWKREKAPKGGLGLLPAAGGRLALTAQF